MIKIGMMAMLLSLCMVACTDKAKNETREDSQNKITAASLESPQVYDVNADASLQIEQAVQKAKAEGKHVLAQVGGNWCPWCIKMHKFIHETPEIDSLVNADFVYILINYSKENRNPEIMKRLDYPQRFGFPVLVLLDGNGQRIHTQDTGLMEKDGGYDSENFTRFLELWRPSALNPANYY